MCGVFGAVVPGSGTIDGGQVAALGLFALQHRGQESAGLAVSDGEQLMVYKDLGLISSVLDERRLPSLRGRLAIAHCRYSTTGSTVWENAQPTFRLGPVTGRPSRRRVPEVGRRRPAMIRSNVVLPHPDGPTIVTNSPGAMSSEMSASAATTDRSWLT